MILVSVWFGVVLLPVWLCWLWFSAAVCGWPVYVFVFELGSCCLLVYC